MKVYVVKNPEGKYLTEMMDFADELIFANLFYDVESAWGYAPNDCRAVECFLMERDERKEHDKQVRKEVCEEIRDKMTHWEDCLTKEVTEYVIDKETLDKIEQGETK